MQKYFLAVLFGIISFFSSEDVLALEKRKIDAIVVCMVTQVCKSSPSVIENEKVLILFVALSNEFQVSLLLSTKGLILNTFVTEQQKALGLFDTDFDGTVDRVKVVTPEQGVIDDRVLAEMTDVEKKLLQDLFDDILAKVHDTILAVPPRKKI